MKYSLSEETLGYVTSQEKSNADKRFLVAGSQNVLINFQKKVSIRSGYYRLGASSSDLYDIKNAFTWNTSQGQHLPLRNYDDELEVYLSSIDGYDINSWNRVSQGWSTTKKIRFAKWYDSTEKIDLLLMVNGDDNIYEWGGGVAVVDSVGVNSVTKKGTTTFAQNHFYTTRNKTFVCVRTGTEYTYTGGEGTTTLTGIAATTGLQANDILVQKIVTNSDKPVANRINDYIFNFENQIAIGSDTDNLVYISSNTAYATFSFSSPRLSGEGALLTLDAPTRGFGILGKSLIIFAGLSSIFKTEFEQLTVGSSIAETLKIRRIQTGLNQGALNQEAIVPIGDSIAYLSNETALRIISNPEELTGINPKTFSNPIKPDFDNENWENAFGFWYKNILFFSAPANSRVYMLNFVEDADGRLFRFWNPPQILPVKCFSLIDSGDGEVLHGHSNSIPETYLLFYGQSDAQYSDMNTENKISIDAKAFFAYNSYKNREQLKNFDEYFVEGEITTNTNDLILTINYDYSGKTQILTKTIDGSDNDILEGNIGINSLAQTSLGDSPLGGLINPPEDARKFRVVFEIAKEDFYEIQVIFSTNAVDRYWSIISHGANAQLSKRRNINIRK